MADGTDGFIHRHVPGRPELTLLALHGTGGDETDLLPVAAAVAPGAGVLSPRGRVSEHGQARFFRRLSPGVFDLDDIRVQAAALARFVADAAERYRFAPDGVWALGYSNGANIAAALLLLQPGTLAGAMLLRPMLPLVPDAPPDLAGVRVWIAAGRADPLVPTEGTERLAGVLRDAGAAVTVRWEPGGHRVGRPEIAAAGAWLAG